MKRFLFILMLIIIIITRSTEAQIWRGSKGCRFDIPHGKNDSHNRVKIDRKGYSIYNSSTPYYITATDDTIYAKWNYQYTLEMNSDGNYIDESGQVYYNPNGRQFYTDSLGNKVYLPNSIKQMHPVEYNRNNNFHFEKGGVYY